MRILAIFVICGWLAVVATAGCVPYASLQTLEFVKDKMNVRTRRPSTPQLQCTGDCQNIVTVHCDATGLGSNNLPLWHCFAYTGCNSFPSLTVQCEGCDNATDPNVDPASCSIIFTAQCSTTSKTTTSRPALSPQDALLVEIVCGSVGGLFVVVMVVVFLVRNRRRDAANGGGGTCNSGGNSGSSNCVVSTTAYLQSIRS